MARWRGGYAMNEQSRQAMRQMRKHRSKAYRAVQICVIFACVLAVILGVIGLVTESLRKPWLFKFVFLVLALCLGGWVSLPWITQAERDRRLLARGENVPAWHKTVIYTFFGIIALCTVMWVIAVFVIGDGVILKLIQGEDVKRGSFTFLEFAIVLTVQAGVATAIAVTTLRYGKNYLPLRCIAYVAGLYLDIWFSWLVVAFFGAIASPSEGGGFVCPPITNPALWVPAILTAAALAVAASILLQTSRRKELELWMKGDVDKLTDGDVDLIDAKAEEDPFAPAPAPAPAGKSAEEKLDELNSLYEKGYLTEEEYAAKRKEIIDNM